MLATDLPLDSAWPRVKLGDNVDLLTGFPFKSASYSDDEDDVRLLRGDNVAQGYLRWDGVKRWPTAEASDYAKFELRPGDVVLAMDRPWIEAGLKYARVERDDLPSLLVQRVARLRGTNSLSSEYLRYVIGSVEFSDYVKSITTGTAVPHISATDICQFEFLLPSLTVQRQIADMLSLWDRTIGLTGKLVTAKQTRKVGLMQQLLTGKSRFSEFGANKWTTTKLGNIFTERRETHRSELPLLSITSNDGVVPRESIERRDTSSEDKSLYQRICQGDIGYNTMRMWQGVSAVSDLEGIVSPAYTICIPHEDIDAGFMGYLFKFPPVIHLFKRYSQGLVDDTLSLKFEAFAKIEVTIPAKEEQRAITQVLSVCDRELSLLRQKLDLLQVQKQALMQQLMTGKVRVAA